jgi:hypothetical protein
MMFRKNVLLVLTVIVAAVSVAGVRADDKRFAVTVVSQTNATNVPISIPVDVSESFAYAKLTDEQGDVIPIQLTAASLLSMSKQRELHFVVPMLTAGATAAFDVALSTETRDDYDSFTWDVDSGKTATLSHSNRNVLKYMFERVDNSSEERRMETYKVFHHVFEPNGQFLVTKGPGGLYPHHRGLFFGFNRISYGVDQKADIWHCRNGESQIHTGFLRSESGSVLGRHKVAIDWNGQDGKAFAKEQRELTAYNVQGGTLIEFASILKPTVDSVRLDGDPQHAGFQFRGSQYIAEIAKDKTYYVRPDGKDEPGSYRNWKNAGDSHANLPWNAQSFVVNDQRFTCCYLDRPENPKEARFSERDYGRFGSYFEYDLTPENPLRLNYRIWLQKGEMTVDQVSSYHATFVEPPTVTIKAR